LGGYFPVEVKFSTIIYLVAVSVSINFFIIGNGLSAGGDNLFVVTALNGALIGALLILSCIMMVPPQGDV